MQRRQQCNFCSTLSDLFRRFTCIGGSRRGSDESYYQPLDNQQSDFVLSNTEADKEEINMSSKDIIYVRIPDHISKERIIPVAEKKLGHRERLTLDESKLLESISYALLETEYRGGLSRRRSSGTLTGRFLTLHKRRRKRLTTRSLSPDTAPALLDDIQHGQVRHILDRIGKWPFNAFLLDNTTGGRALSVLCVHLFHFYGLLEAFHLDVVDVWKLFSLIEEGYHSKNPYHNAIHATDVTQAMHCFIQEQKILKYLTPLEIMAALIAAVSHDYDHPGVSQNFLIATNNYLAILYKNESVLEQHHWRSAIGCLWESGLGHKLKKWMPQLEYQIRSLILATDINRQPEFLSKLKNYLDTDTLNMNLPEVRHFILQIGLKCADICNPCRPWEISRKWSLKVCEEFFRQGDYELQLGIPVTPICDRHNSPVPKIQIGFIAHIVMPLFEEWHRYLQTRLSDTLVNNIRVNRKKWEFALQQQSATDDIRYEFYDELILEDPIIPIIGNGWRRKSVPSVVLETTDRTGRRFSVPLNLCKPVTCGQRRDSVPDHQRQMKYPFLHPIPQEDDYENQSGRNSSCGSNRSERVERPVSAESLLPDPTIATITTDAQDATKLCNVLHGTSFATTCGRPLTRQQTFPPLQSFVRARYLSAASEVPPPNANSNSNSSSSNSSRNELNPRCYYNRSNGSTDSSSEYNTAKRDSSSSSGGDSGESKTARLMKFSQKENLDPKKDSCESRSLPFGEMQYIRRGSAPVAPDGTMITVKVIDKLYFRRGSMPDQPTRHRHRGSDIDRNSRKSSHTRKPTKRRGSAGIDPLLPPDAQYVPRRGSLPCEIFTATSFPPGK